MIVEDSIVIAAEAAGLFALSQDAALGSRWDPFVRSQRYLDGASAPDVGVRVWVRAWTGLTMVVRFVRFRPPQTVAMERGPLAFQRFAGTWRFSPAPGGGTRVVFRYAFTARGGPLRPALERAIAALFRRDVRARLLGLKAGVERDGLLEAVDLDRPGADQHDPGDDQAQRQPHPQA